MTFFAEKTGALARSKSETLVPPPAPVSGSADGRICCLPDPGWIESVHDSLALKHSQQAFDLGGDLGGRCRNGRQDHAQHELDKGCRGGLGRAVLNSLVIPRRMLMHQALTPAPSAPAPAGSPPC